MMIDNILNYVIFSCAIVLLFNTVIQLWYKQKYLLNYCLAGIYFSAGYSMLYFWFFRIQIIYDLPVLMYTDLFFALLGMYLLYLYVTCITGETSKITLRSLFHFLPPFLALAVILAYNITNEPLIDLSITNPSQHRYIQKSTVINIVSFSVRVSFFIYSILSIIKLSAVLTRKSLKEARELKTFLFFIYFYLINTIILIIANSTGNIYLVTAGIFLFNFQAILYIFFSFLHPEFAQKVITTSRRVRYENRILKGVDTDKIVARIEELLEEDKIFRDDEITLEKLSAMLKSSTHQVSRIINQQMNMNFSTLISTCRLKEACRLLSNCPEMNILEIAFAVGFNSKTTFNTSFIKKYKQSPREYRKLTHSS